MFRPDCNVFPPKYNRFQQAPRALVQVPPLYVIKGEKQKNLFIWFFTWVILQPRVHVWATQFNFTVLRGK